jgi:hypothetical protein
MKRLYKIGAAFGVATAGLLVGTAQMAQAAPKIPTTVPAGYRIVYSGQYTANPGTQTFGYATCPGTEQPASGGLVNFSAGFASSINSSYPHRHSWEVDFNNQGQYQSGFVVYAVCLAANAGYKVVSHIDVANPAFSQSYGYVACPTGTKITGGGATSYSADPNVSINDSFPENNGWQVDMDNNTVTDSLFTVVAVCHPTPKGYSVRSTGNIDNPPGATTTASLACPGSATNVAIGGGVFASTLDTHVQLYASFPDSSGGWTNYEQNNGSSDDGLAAYAICAGI